MNQPSHGIFMTSDIPNDIEPMKSFLDVRSQSQHSTKSLRSLSSGFKGISSETSEKTYFSRQYASKKFQMLFEQSIPSNVTRNEESKHIKF